MAQHGISVPRPVHIQPWMIGRLLYGAMALMVVVFMAVVVNLTPPVAPALIETVATTASGSVVTATGAAGQSPLAAVDHDRRTAWPASIAGSSWMIQPPCRKAWQVKVWAGTSGIWPTTTGWESSIDGVKWTPIVLTAHGGQTASAGDPQAFALAKIEAQFLRFTPAVTPAGILEVELR